MDNYEAIDFFRDDAMIVDPYPYFEAIRTEGPGLARTPSRCGDDHRIRRSDGRLQRYRLLLLLHLGHRSLSGLSGPAGGR